MYTRALIIPKTNKDKNNIDCFYIVSKDRGIQCHCHTLTLRSKNSYHRSHLLNPNNILSYESVRERLLWVTRVNMCRSLDRYPLRVITGKVTAGYYRAAALIGFQIDIYCGFLIFVSVFYSYASSLPIRDLGN
uniref:Uncharacterized protein n=1 Tax=Glossina brevipalpis TaxID=37001 RepID=A0A1A9WL10_9MUSC